MPELDPDLVNLLTIGLLAVIVILLLVAISSIGRVRKAIERAAAQRERQREDRWESAAPSAAAQTGTVEPEPAIERSPEPAASTRAADSSSQEQEPATAEPVGATAGGGGPGAVTAGTAAGATAAGSSRGEAYAGGTSEGAVSSSTAEPAAASTTASTQTTNEPQEQPFERDGRWWFRRGSELLVYDEGTGQWMTAPEERGRHSPMETQPIPTTISNVATESSTGEASVSEQHGFWKCPSCGAVNGSTATSCRMCFTARP
jgi:hypothetical protein